MSSDTGSTGSTGSTDPQVDPELDDAATGMEQEVADLSGGDLRGDDGSSAPPTGGGAGTLG